MSCVPRLWLPGCGSPAVSCGSRRTVNPINQAAPLSNKQPSAETAAARAADGCLQTTADPGLKTEKTAGAGLKTDDRRFTTIDVRITQVCSVDEDLEQGRVRTTADGQLRI